MSAPVVNEQVPVAVQMPDDLSGNLRQMIAVLQDERQALAGLDTDALMACTLAKESLCEVLKPIGPEALDNEARALAETAQQLNDVNRRVRNLLAANVTTRLEALGGIRPTYTPVRLAHA